eukprot:291977-Chlamydomonas_euryale.AAC.2
MVAEMMAAAGDLPPHVAHALTERPREEYPYYKDSPVRQYGVAPTLDSTYRAHFDEKVCEGGGVEGRGGGGKAEPHAKPAGIVLNPLVLHWVGWRCAGGVALGPLVLARWAGVALVALRSVGWCCTGGVALGRLVLRWWRCAGSAGVAVVALRWVGWCCGGGVALGRLVLRWWCCAGSAGVAVVVLRWVG